MKFYPQDWRSDEKLRMCSLAARGLWIEMLALMHRSERYGQLLISGRVPTDVQLAVQVGALPDEVSAMLTELEDAGVFSRAAGGTIYSRRMTRDHKKAENARKNGKRGGNPSLSKQTGNPASDNPDLSQPLNSEARSQKPEEAKASSAGDDVGLTADACRRAGIEVPDPGRNFAKHSDAIALVQGWIQAGADPDMILNTIAKRAASSTSSPRSLRYFDGAVREAIEQAKGQKTEAEAYADRIIAAAEQRRLTATGAQH